MIRGVSERFQKRLSDLYLTVPRLNGLDDNFLCCHGFNLWFRLNYHIYGLKERGMLLTINN